MRIGVLQAVAMSLAVLALGGCGGGGGGGGGSGIVSAPKPPSTPTPTVTLLGQPSTQTFASYNSGPGTMGIRYDSGAKKYEVTTDASTWRALSLTATPNMYSFGTSTSLNILDEVPGSYVYSHIGNFFDGSEQGDIAFGIATPSGAVPTVGAATFSGEIVGQTDAIYYCGICGAQTYVSVGGEIQLSFDFAAGTLGGNIKPVLLYASAWEPTRIGLGTYNFRDTIYSTGSTTFSGQFDTALSGANSFSGRFAGPAAQEAIGKWALPFVWAPVPDLPIGDGEVHSAFGVFIARR